VATEKDGIRLGKRIEFWQRRLEPLGVGHWRIDAVHIVDEPTPGREAAACVRPSAHYDHCEFWFKHDYIDNCSARDLDLTIIHEWVHVAMRSLDNAIEIADDMLGSVVEEVWNARIVHERENLVERISRQIYVLWEVESRASPATIRRLDRTSMRPSE
jgi:hypothetical protein